MKKIKSLWAIEKNHTRELEAIIKALGDPVIIVNRNGIVVKSNPAARRAFGFNAIQYSWKEIIKKINLRTADDESGDSIPDWLMHSLKIGKVKERAFFYSDNKDHLHRILAIVNPIKINKTVQGFVVAWHDITERHMRLEKLKQSEQRYRFFYNNTQSINMIIGNDGTIIDINKGGLKELNYKRGDLVGRKLSSIIVKEQNDIFKTMMFDSKRKKGYLKQEIDIMAKDCSTHTWLFTSSHEPYIENGRIIGYLFASIDISERKTMLKQLSESRERFALAQRMARMITWEWDIKTDRLIWSEKSGCFFGRSVQLPSSFPKFLSMIEKEDRPILQTALDVCIEEGKPFQCDCRIHIPSHQMRWLTLSGNVVRDETNLAVRLLCVMQDITLDKGIEQRQAMFTALVVSSNDAIMNISPNGVIQSWNQGAKRLYGYRAQDCIGRSIEMLIPPELKTEWKRLLKIAMTGKQQKNLETQRLTKSAKRIHISLTLSPIKNTKKQIVAISSIERDITENIMWQQELQQAKEGLEVRVKKRTRELHQMNLELKREIKQRIQFQEKLQSMTSELIRTEERQRRKIAAGLHDKVIQMLIFSNIKLDQLMFDLSSDSQKNEIKVIKRNLDDTIEELRTMTIQISPPVLYEVGLVPALEGLTEQFENQYGLTCYFEDDHVEKPVTDDVRNMLFQGVKELLTNITKHAKADNAWVQVKKKRKNILIEVRDDGCGFNPSKMKLDPASHSGFGLFNIKERIEFLNGQFHIQSGKNQGTYIRLQAPLKK